MLGKRKIFVTVFVLIKLTCQKRLRKSIPLPEFVTIINL
jgi:hypothetical protein